MIELRAGGLAIIINSRITSNIGKTVVLISHLGVMQGHAGIEVYDSWDVRGASNNKLMGYLPDGSIVAWTNVFCPSQWLMPIDGDDFQEEDQKQKDLQHT